MNLFIPPLYIFSRNGVPKADYTVKKEVFPDTVRYHVFFERLPRRIRISDKVIGVIKSIVAHSGHIAVTVSPYISVDCDVIARGVRIRDVLYRVEGDTYYIGAPGSDRFGDVELDGIVCIKNGEHVAIRDMTKLVETLLA